MDNEVINLRDFKHRKLLLSIFGLIAATSAQENIELPCNYHLSFFGEYVCELFSVDDYDRDTTTVTFVGDHLEGYTETDVDVVGIYFSDITFIIPEIFTTFPNLNELDMEFTGLIDIDQFPTDIPNFAYFTSFFGYVEVIRNNTFENVGETMLYLDMALNELEEIEQTAFANCGSLSLMYLLYNRVPHPPEETFWPLVSLIALDIDSNDFVVLEETLFINSTELLALWVERNEIDRIAPTFSAPFNLEVFAAFGNECIDRGFDISEPIDVAFMHASLQQCYNAFTGAGPDDLKTVSFQYQGPLSFSDSFGNPILVMN